MEKGLLNFIDFLDDVVCSISAEDFRVKYINRAAEEVLGYTPEDFLDDAQLFVKIIHPEDREFVLKTFENLLNDKKFDIEFRVISPGKKIIWIRARGKLSYVPSDSSPYIFCVLRDISRRMMEQKELSYQLAFQKLVSHISKEFVNFSPINFDEKVLYAL
ncbi:MAG: Diguanylate cyclase/phosphodiesterase with PAS/PAC sensor [Clostridia bacterium 41_269]|nr:MAG: Diguanylate cyclase/phosphodiesterase with PAS/PAC sensor [Clostridia bacterium 41_269]